MLVWKQASLSPPGTLRAVIPGSWLRKKKKEDEGVTSLASPFRQQEKKKWIPNQYKYTILQIK